MNLAQSGPNTVKAAGPATVISYEFPVNERIRTLLRLEDLYNRAAFFSGREHALEHHAALLCLFEIMEVAGRADLKSDLLQELERQRQTLEALRDNPQISEEALDMVLADIEHTHTRLLEPTGKFAQHLRENEWLMAIKQRSGIPGGVCQFDLPSYHYWQQQAVGERQHAINGWLNPMLPIKDGIDIVLRILRNSAKVFPLLARNGAFQQMSGGKTVQLLKVSVDENLPYVPELSANKYAINVRFVSPVANSDRPRQCEHDVEFTLAFCNL
ncbi:cell division protein ZapD [Chitinimonas taiwanensis]|uniref:Cell division protein ZapD n=1 Tax=Chitinimonas taiwanensis DSM 18899 TaxID=1121279 RepID=A0A1K2HHD4_9NEIS|nr:cell division protein ZapD [Chitinimonas taiwanensis]SFZ75905.1 cell division protein ZapD [Chitinimonas taiwanensis DSM 18899]